MLRVLFEDFLKKSRLKRPNPKSNECSAILATQTHNDESTSDTGSVNFKNDVKAFVKEEPNSSFEIIISDDESVPANSCKVLKIFMLCILI